MMKYVLVAAVLFAGCTMMSGCSMLNPSEKTPGVNNAVAPMAAPTAAKPNKIMVPEQ